jgi:hypothetical protein
MQCHTPYSEVHKFAKSLEHVCASGLVARSSRPPTVSLGNHTEVLYIPHIAQLR